MDYEEWDLKCLLERRAVVEFQYRSNADSLEKSLLRRNRRMLGTSEAVWNESEIDQTRTQGKIIEVRWSSDGLYMVVQASEQIRIYRLDEDKWNCVEEIKDFNEYQVRHIETDGTIILQQEGVIFRWQLDDQQISKIGEYNGHFFFIDGQLIVHSGTNIIGISISNGFLVGEYNHCDKVKQLVRADDGQLYFQSAQDDLYRLDLEDNNAEKVCNLKTNRICMKLKQLDVGSWWALFYENEDDGGLSTLKANVISHMDSIQPSGGIDNLRMFAITGNSIIAITRENNMMLITLPSFQVVCTMNLPETPELINAPSQRYCYAAIKLPIEGWRFLML